MTFNDLELTEAVRQGLKDVGFSEPTPIQEQCIPFALEGRDILGAAQTGTGKTGAFVIPILEKILRESTEGTKALILSPTRELAQQIDEQIFAIGYHTGVSSALVIGGADFGQQANAIRAGVDIIIATPGRLIDQMKVLSIDFKHLRFLVLDEADRMLDMGFLPDVKTIVNSLPKEKQTMLFSATMPPELQKLMKSIMIDPINVQIEASTTSKKVTQRAFYAPPRKKLNLVQTILETEEWKSCIIFASTKKGTGELEALLNANGISAGSIHGDKTQEERTKSLLAFKNGKIPVIVATDVLARGIDIDDVSIIINYDVPRAVEDYIHRIGRTGRYDKEGLAVTLVSKADEKYFEPILKKVGDKLTVLDAEEVLSQSDEIIVESDNTEQAGRVAVSVNTLDSASKTDAEAANIMFSKDAAGKVVVKLKSKDDKDQEEPVKAESFVEAKADKAIVTIKKPGHKDERKTSDLNGDRREQAKPVAKKEGPLVMPERVEKATERNRRTRKPAKGIWGIIKSFIPKFG